MDFGGALRGRFQRSLGPEPEVMGNPGSVEDEHGSG